MVAVGDYVYTRRWWDPSTEAEQQLGEPNVAVVVAAPAGEIKCTLRFFYRPAQTRHHATETFFEQEVLLSSKTTDVSLPDGVCGPCCVLPEADYVASDPASPHALDDAHVFVCSRRYDPKSTSIKKIQQRDSLPKPKLTRRDEPRELVKITGVALRVGRPVTIAGVTSVFVADADVPVHIKNVVKNPPAPVSVYCPKTARRTPKRATGGLGQMATAAFSEAALDATDGGAGAADAAPGPLDRAAMHGAVSSAAAMDVEDGFAGRDLYQFSAPKRAALSASAGGSKRRRTDAASVRGGFEMPAVGARVSAVFDDQGRVLGTVTKVNLSKGRVHVRYDDGDEGWADHPDEGFEVIDAGGGGGGTGSGGNGAALVGRRVRAYFEGQGHVLGTVSKARDRKKNNVYVVYDDGDEGWADYPDEGFEVIDDDGAAVGTAGAAAAAKAGKAKARSRSVLEDAAATAASSSDEDEGGGDDDDDDDDDESDETDDDDDVDDDDDESAGRGAAVAARRAAARRSLRASGKVSAGASSDEDGEEDDAAGFASQQNRDDYFHLSKPSAKRGTSDRTLSKLDAATMDQTEIAAALNGFHPATEKQQRVLVKRQATKAESWVPLLNAGFNILCHGFGSKKELLMQFAFEHFKGHNIVVVNGYFPSLSVKHVLKTIIENGLGYDGGFRSVFDQVEFVRDKLSASPTEGADYYIVVHNIDGPMIRNETSQTVLSMLAEIPRVHLIASIDHINAPLMWDHAKLAKFNWVWQDCTTFASYATETSYENPLTAATTALSVRGALAVMQSLTRNGRKVFWVLLEYQVQNQQDSDYRGLRFAQYLAMCQKQFAAHDDARLRSYMTEFMDHKLLVVRKYDGVEHLLVPAKASLLDSLMDMMKDNFEEDAPR